MLDNKPNQLSKSETKNWVYINGKSRGTYNKDNQMLRSGSCNYRDAHILVKGTITVADETAVAPKKANKKVIFRNCAS